MQQRLITELETYLQTLTDEQRIDAINAFAGPCIISARSATSPSTACCG